jgi:superoxide dismutase, Fe-Mn family
VFGVDIWEHAFYLQVRKNYLFMHRSHQLITWTKYLNNKAAYVAAIWSVINWKVAEERYLGKQADAFKVLKAAI